MSKIKVLFVCLGNICRSPMAEGVFRHLVENEGLANSIEIDSAGTGPWHVGNKPDGRAIQAAGNRGIDLSTQRARQVRPADMETFDYILAMDEDNYHNLLQMTPAALQDKIHLFLDFAPTTGVREVPDPYFGGPDGFENALDLVEEAAQGLLAHLQENHRLS